AAPEQSFAAPPDVSFAPPQQPQDRSSDIVEAQPIAGTPALYGSPQASTAIYGTPPAAVEQPAEQRAAASPVPTERRKSRRRSEEGARLRAECGQLRERGRGAGEAAARAAQEAEEARVQFVAAQRAADEARSTVERIAQEAADVAAQI